MYGLGDLPIDPALLGVGVGVGAGLGVGVGVGVGAGLPGAAASGAQTRSRQRHQQHPRVDLNAIPVDPALWELQASLGLGSHSSQQAYQADATAVRVAHAAPVAEVMDNDRMSAKSGGSQVGSPGIGYPDIAAEEDIDPALQEIVQSLNKAQRAQEAHAAQAARAGLSVTSVVQPESEAELEQLGTPGEAITAEHFSELFRHAAAAAHFEQDGTQHHYQQHSRVQAHPPAHSLYEQQHPRTTAVTTDHAHHQHELHLPLDLEDALTGASEPHTQRVTIAGEYGIASASSSVAGPSRITLDAQIDGTFVGMETQLDQELDVPWHEPHSRQISHVVDEHDGDISAILAAEGDVDGDSAGNGSGVDGIDLDIAAELEAEAVGDEAEAPPVKRGRGRPKGSKNKRPYPSRPFPPLPKPKQPKPEVERKPIGRPPRQREGKELEEWLAKKEARAAGVVKQRGRPRKFPGYLVREMRLSKNREEFRRVVQDHEEAQAQAQAQAEMETQQFEQMRGVPLDAGEAPYANQAVMELGTEQIGVPNSEAGLLQQVEHTESTASEARGSSLLVAQPVVLNKGTKRNTPAKDSLAGSPPRSKKRMAVISPAPDNDSVLSRGSTSHRHGVSSQLAAETTADAALSSGAYQMGSFHNPHHHDHHHHHGRHAMDVASNQHDEHDLQMQHVNMDASHELGAVGDTDHWGWPTLPEDAAHAGMSQVDQGVGHGGDDSPAVASAGDDAEADQRFMEAVRDHFESMTQLPAA